MLDSERTFQIKIRSRTLDTFQNFAYAKSYLHLKSFAWKKDYPISSKLQMSWSSTAVSLPHLLHGFWRKIFLWLYSINWQNFIFSWPLLREILDNMCIVIEKVFYLTKMPRQKKNKYLRAKELLRWNKKAFFINFQGFLPKIALHLRLHL